MVLYENYLTCIFMNINENFCNERKNLKKIRLNLDLHLSISNDIFSTKIYDKRDDFDFEIVNFPFLDGDVPRSTSYGVYISTTHLFCQSILLCCCSGSTKEDPSGITERLLMGRKESNQTNKQKQHNPTCFD